MKNELQSKERGGATSYTQLLSARPSGAKGRLAAATGGNVGRTLCQLLRRSNIALEGRYVLRQRDTLLVYIMIIIYIQGYIITGL